MRSVAQYAADFQAFFCIFLQPSHLFQRESNPGNLNTIHIGFEELSFFKVFVLNSDIATGFSSGFEPQVKESKC